MSSPSLRLRLATLSLLTAFVLLAIYLWVDITRRPPLFHILLPICALPLLIAFLSVNASNEKQGTPSSCLMKEKIEEEETTARHQQSCCALVDVKNAETEMTRDELTKEKKTLENTVTTVDDTKYQTLSQEISSLNTALALRSTQMKELRLENRKLTMRVDELPGKELEISKLKHKITELKLQLDQKREREKLLFQQNEELRRKERTSAALSERYRTQVDLLQFQLGMSNEDEDVELSTRARNLDDSMTRSVVGMYAANKAKIAALDRDVIFAPDEVLSNHSCKLSLGDERKKAGIGI